MLYAFNFLPHPQNLRNDNSIYRESHRIDLSVPSRQSLMAIMNYISDNGRADLGMKRVNRDIGKTLCGVGREKLIISRYDFF